LRAETYTTSASAGAIRVGRYATTPQMNITARRIVGTIDHTSSSGVLCDGLGSAATPGRRRYRMPK